MYETRSYKKEKDARGNFGACGNFGARGNIGSFRKGRNSRRRAVAWLLTMVLAFSGIFMFAGCSEGVTDQAARGEDTSEIAGTVSADLQKRVNAPVQASYFITNNIDIESVSVPSEDGREGDYIVISGLADKEVEEKINDTIYKTFLKNLQNDNPPPYRGAKLKVGSAEAPQSVFVTMQVTANINNILSICVSRSMYFKEDSSVYFGDATPLNIDLNTGNSIKLSEMFTDNTDYYAYVNDAIEAEILKTDYDSEEYSYLGNFDIILTAPFSGVSENQKFYLNGSDGSISLIVDYSMPDFYTENYYTLITIPYSEKMAFTKRFMEQISIFDDTTINKRLIAGSGYDANTLKSDSSFENDGNFSKYMGFSYYEAQPDYVLEKINEFMDGGEAYADEIYQKYTEYAQIYGSENIYGVVYMYANASNIAGMEYILLEKSANIYTVGDDFSLDGALNFFDTNVSYLTFEKNSDEIMEFSELFKEPKNRNKLMKQAIHINMENYLDEECEWPDDTDKFIDEALKHVDGFYPATDCFYPSYDCDLQKLASEVLGCSYDEAYRFAYVCGNCGIAYRDVGCGALRLFR